MNYRALIVSSLVEIGVDADRVQQIESGAAIYGDNGLLDSLYLVAFIAALEERLSAELDTSVSPFGERNVALLDGFRDVQTLTSLLADCASGKAAAKK